MNDTCGKQERISDLQRNAWLNREYQVAGRLLRELNEHERECPKCQAIRNGAGLAGGLWPGVEIAETVNSG